MLISPCVGLCERSLFDGDESNEGVGAKQILGEMVSFGAAAVATPGNGASTDSSVARETASSMSVERITGRGRRTKMAVDRTAVIIIKVI